MTVQDLIDSVCATEDFDVAPGMLLGGLLRNGPTMLDVIDPSTGAVFARCTRADATMADAAVDAARSAFEAWSATSIDERAELIAALAEKMEQRRNELSKLLSREQGKPIAQATGEVSGAIATLRYYAEQRLPIEIIRESAVELIAEQRVPLGVVVAITPWNFPVSLLAGKIAPALLAGNTVVAKPAPTTPLTTLLIGALAADILPAGVLNIIVDDNDLGARLTSHPDVAKISFTGSTGTGKKVMAGAAGSLKRITLELGGNDAAIVLDDADVPRIAPQLFRAAMVNAGQVCMAAKRVYVARQRYDEMCGALAALARAAVVGPGHAAASEIGPLQNRAQYERVLSLIEGAQQQGTIIAGGPPPNGGGYFIPPTIVRDLSNEATLVVEEQFGPVIPVIAFDSDDEVVDFVNSSEFGLGASVWSEDLPRAYAIAQRVVSGTVWVNRHLDLPLDVSFGGAKQSGIGRERGRAGLEEFTQLKVINILKK